MRCIATDGNGHECTGLPERHAGRHLGWTSGPIGQREPLMWHDDRTRDQADRMRQAAAMDRLIDPVE